MQPPDMLYGRLTMIPIGDARTSYYVQLDVADLKHTGDRFGGSITAALFLREFVGDTPWVHVDVAGPSMANKAYNVFAKGGTGHGVLTFLKLIEDYST